MAESRRARCREAPPLPSPHKSVPIIANVPFVSDVLGLESFDLSPTMKATARPKAALASGRGGAM